MIKSWMAMAAFELLLALCLAGMATAKNVTPFFSVVCWFGFVFLLMLAIDIVVKGLRGESD